MGLSIPVYNHPWDASISTLLVHLSIYRSQSTIIQRMRLLRHCRYMYWSIGLGLQPSKGCFYFCTAVYHHPRAATASIGLSVSVWPLGMVYLPHTVYNHLTEGFFPKPSVQFSDTVYNYPRNCSFSLRTFLFIQGTSSSSISRKVVNLSDLFYNHRRTRFSCPICAYGR